MADARAVALPASPGTRWLALAGALAAVYVVWGSTYLAISLALESFPPLLLMGVRSVVAGGALYGTARAGGAAPAQPREWLSALRVGVLFFVIGHGLLAWGETRVASGAAAVLIATEPLFIVLLGWLGASFLPRAAGVRPGRNVVVALVLGLAGVSVLTLPGARGALDPLGVAALVFASFSWAVGTFYVSPDGSPVRNAGMQLLCGGIILFVLATSFGELTRFTHATVEPRALLALVYLIVVGSVITFSAYVWLLRELGAARVASHTYVNPVIAVALGAALAGEPLTFRMLVASLMILTAVTLLVRSRRAP